MLKYIELKTGYSDNGPAWIARVTISKSGRTIYFNGMALKHTITRGPSYNHFDIETGDGYWVSGVKKSGMDRHWAGSGRIAIEASAVPEYLVITGRSSLDPRRYDVIDDLPATGASQFLSLEHAKTNPWRSDEDDAPVVVE